MKSKSTDRSNIRAIDDRENYLKNARFEGPSWIPASVCVSDASWDQYRYEMEYVALRHPLLFPQVKKGWRDYDNYDFAPGCAKDEPVTDAWGCVWLSGVNGLEGAVMNAPLENWDDLDTYRIPDPDVTGDRGPAQWSETKREVENRRKRGLITFGGPAHGFLFLRLQYLRGFENFMVDIASDEPRLGHLIDMIVDHNMKIVNNYLRMGVEVLGFGDDLGTQLAPMISPSDFQKWIKPGYSRLMAPCKEAGALVFLHSDGRTLDILDDQIKAGVDIVNPQDLCNGIDNLAKYIKGRACISLDIDRQSVIPYGTRKEIHDLIEEEVRKLGDPSGGLEFVAGIYPPTSPDNVDALCEALEKYMTYWWD